MFSSCPGVHPVEAPAMTDAVDNPQGVRMKDLPEMPGALGDLLFRFSQFVFAFAHSPSWPPPPISPPSPPSGRSNRSKRSPRGEESQPSVFNTFYP